MENKDKLRAIKIRENYYAVRHIDKLGTLLYNPKPFGVVFVKAYSETDAIRNALHVKDRRTGSASPAHERHGYKLRWIENVERGFGWRNAGFADEIAKRNDCRRSIDNQGWFTDDDGYGDVMRGIVYRLPHGKLLAGYADPCNPDCACLSTEIYTDEMEAARAADRIAERCAEAERDYQRAYEELRQAKEKANEARETVREHITELRELREVGLVNPRDYERAEKFLGIAWEQYREAFDSVMDAKRHAKWQEISYSDVD